MGALKYWDPDNSNYNVRNWSHQLQGKSIKSFIDSKDKLSFETVGKGACLLHYYISRMIQSLLQYQLLFTHMMMSDV